jgi:hypothetical protein
MAEEEKMINRTGKKTRAEEMNPDDPLRKALLKAPVPSVPTTLDPRVSNGWDEFAFHLQLRKQTADIQLRRLIALSLISVFSFSVCITALIVILIGLGRLKLPPEIIYILLASTIAEGVFLYRQVIADLFGQFSERPGKARVKGPHVQHYYEGCRQPDAL